MKAFHNGKLIPKADLQVHCDTVAFKYGAMVFEGIRSYWNERRHELLVFRLDDHSRRLADSVRIMRMETSLTSTDYSEAVLAVLAGNDVRENAHIRQMVYVDGGGEMFVAGPVSHAVIVTPKARWFADPGIHASISSWQRITDTSMPPRVKCAANYQKGRLALMQARIEGYDSAILLNAAGKISEEARGCIFLVRKGRVSTPRITDGILESITRDTLIQLFWELHRIEVAEREIDRTELYLADEVFVCGSGLEVTPILSIDRHVISSAKPGELTQVIKDSYLQAAHGELEQYRAWLTPVALNVAKEEHAS